MKRIAFASFLLFGLSFVFTPSAALAQEAPAPAEVKEPTKPLELTAPKAPEPQYLAYDLREFSAGELRGNANRMRSADDLAGAAQLQHWAVVADPTRGVYDLACYYALNGDIEAAVYWLQEAGMAEGVDVEYAVEDADLEAVRKDARWGKLLEYLTACNAYWVASDHSRDFVLVPEGHDPAEPLPTIIALHGWGSAPDDFAAEEADQEFVNDLGVGLISMSATNCRGRNSWVWSQDVAKDAERVQRAIDAAKPKLTIKPGFAITTGFSQGGQLALELAAREPEFYAGSISLCAGGFDGEPKLGEIADTSKIGNLMVYIIGGAEEQEGNRNLRDLNELFFIVKGAATVHHEFAEYGHAFPQPYFELAKLWVKSILARPHAREIEELKESR